MKKQDKDDRVDAMTEEAQAGRILEALDGVKVKAKGWCMLSKVKTGKKYRLKPYNGKGCKAVTFYPLRGKREVVTHEAWSVLRAIQSESLGYLNGLELL